MLRDDVLHAVVYDLDKSVCFLYCGEVRRHGPLELDLGSVSGELVESAEL